MKKTMAFVLMALCLAATAGCSTIGKGVDEVGYTLHLADRPETYDRNDSTYASEDFLAGYRVKPDAKPWIGKSHDLIKVWRGTSENANLRLKEQAAVLGKMDTSPSDSLVTEAEAETYFIKFRDRLAKGLEIDVSEVGVAIDGHTVDSASTAAKK